MALPSPSRQSTGRSGQAIGGAGRHRQAVADGAAGELEPVVRRRAPQRAVKARPTEIDSSTTMAFSGRRAQSAAASVSGVIGPSRAGAERSAPPPGPALVRRPTRRERGERGAEVLAGRARQKISQSCGRQHARLSG
jgi:hypothetical protein